MIVAEDVALVVLAAGRSTRFGAADKLSVDFAGKPLALHVVAALREMPFGARYAVCADANVDFAHYDYTRLWNDRPETGMSGSIRIGVAAARDARLAAVLIVLADMPLVTAAHVASLLATADGDDAVVASSDSGRISPPALFGRGRFADLLALEGDAGARALIRAGRQVVAPPGTLLDIDRPEDLARAR